MRDWIVIVGHLLDTVKGGGFEFFGPFTEAEAITYRNAVVDSDICIAVRQSDDSLCIAVQLLKAIPMERSDEKVS